MGWVRKDNSTPVFDHLNSLFIIGYGNIPRSNFKLYFNLSALIFRPHFEYPIYSWTAAEGVDVRRKG